MARQINLSPSQKTIFLLLLLWWVITTIDAAFPRFLHTPEWATGMLYPVWLLLLFWGILIAVGLPSGFAVVVGYKLYGKIGSLVLGFIALWVFDTQMRKYFPTLLLTPGFVLFGFYTYLMVGVIRRKKIL